MMIDTSVPRTQRLADLEPAFSGQHEVEQHEIGLVRAHPVLDLVAPVQNGDLESFLYEIVAQQTGELFLVFDDQYSVSHGRCFRRRRAARCRLRGRPAGSHAQ